MSKFTGFGVLIKRVNATKLLSTLAGLKGFPY